MTPTELAEVRDVIHTTLQEHSKPVEELAKEAVQKAIEYHKTGDSHEFVNALMAKQKRKTEQWEKLKGNYFFVVTVGVSSAFGWWVWEHFIDTVKAVIK